ncbi:hypothetical protein ACFLZR_01390, partial [Candidatus Neomarinimicrobiota bacterium]
MLRIDLLHVMLMDFLGRYRARLFRTVATVALLGISSVKANVEYTIGFDDRLNHTVTIRAAVDEIAGREFIDFVLPAWTPGSYAIRDFARNVLDFQAMNGNQSLAVTKMDKQTWRVYLDGAARIIAQYKVYAFEASVRTSFVDADGAILNGASLFMYVDGMQTTEHLIIVNRPVSWQQVTTSLESIGGNNQVFRTDSYDLLVDSPIMVGNHDELTFQVNQIEHQYAIMGSGNYDSARLLSDSRNVIAEIFAVFGQPAYSDYKIFLQLRENGYGGLEHMNSTHLLYPRWSFAPESRYKQYLELLAHEVFHAYNIKRIR